MKQTNNPRIQSGSEERNATSTEKLHTVYIIFLFLRRKKHLTLSGLSRIFFPDPISSYKSHILNKKELVSNFTYFSCKMALSLYLLESSDGHTNKYLTFEVPTATNTSTVVRWLATQCSLRNGQQHFSETPNTKSTHSCIDRNIGTSQWFPLFHR